MSESKYKKVEVEKDLVRALKQVYDPDIQVNVYDLGLIYEVKVTAKNEEDSDTKSESSLFDVYVKMTLTSPTCPIADDIVRDVETAVRDVPGVGDVKIELTFEPEWGVDRISDEAKLELGLL